MRTDRGVDHAPEQVGGGAPRQNTHEDPVQSDWNTATHLMTHCTLREASVTLASFQTYAETHRSHHYDLMMCSCEQNEQGATVPANHDVGDDTAAVHGAHCRDCGPEGMEDGVADVVDADDDYTEADGHHAVDDAPATMYHIYAATFQSHYARPHYFHH